MLSVKERYRPMVSSLRATASNAAVVVGPTLAGVAIFFNYIKGIFIIAGVCYLIGVCLILFFTKASAGSTANSKTFSLSVYKEIGQNKRFINLLIYMFLTWFLYAQLFITIPDYARLFTNHVEQVFLINGMMGILLQYPTGVVMSKVNNPNVFLTLGTILFPFSFFILGFIQGQFGLYIGIILFTLGELFMFPTVEAMVADFSSDKSMAAYFGVSSLGDGLGRPAGSFLGSILFGMVPSYSFGWYVFSFVGFGLFLYYFIFLRVIFFRLIHPPRIRYLLNHNYIVWTKEKHPVIN
ncbi:MFS transporter [Virgibacillus sp. 179-BFC.A HS]|uniref:MFS transporter n=1 Tax=Tigheibacillus jepli TaxID=3035914 RepID=A0ABU5CJ07_9BACI|nr:MFS transporter [Virgibacillus sp. 179-BFC.A HS]MDY0406291.1 MFS transporter [Virgibacillus sp. 179-BFC.A HS]